MEQFYSNKMIIIFLILFPAHSVTVSRIPSTGTPPIRRLYPVSVYFKNSIYTFGGQGSDIGNLNELNRFDLANNMWQKIEPIDGYKPLGRIVFGMFTTDSQIYINGGLGSNGQLNDMWKFDIISTLWQRVDQQGDIPPPFYRVGFTDYIYNDTKYFAITWFGTRTLSASDDLYIFNSKTETWVLMPKIAKEGHGVPTPRQLWNLNYYNGFLYLWGGTEKAQLLYRYDLEQEQWELVAVEGAMPTERTFFNSSVYKDSLIIFTGWHGETETDLDEYWKFDFTQLQSSATPRWEELQVNRSGNYFSYLPRDSYALSVVENRAYIHGGYSDSNPTGNFLVSINLDDSPRTWQLISGNSDLPPNRYFHSMNVIQGKFYVYGGSTGTQVLDELWIYDEMVGTWERKESLGISPGPRMGHSSGVIGNILLIFGGRQEQVYYKDVFAYNTLTNVWVSIPIFSEISPTAVEGAWMVMNESTMYLFGGKSDFTSNNYLWKFTLGINEFELIAGDEWQIPAVSYASCYAMDNKLYFMYGADDNTYSPAEICTFDLSTYKWEKYPQNVANGFGLSSVAFANLEHIVIAASGSRYNNRWYGDVYTMNFDTGEFKHATTLDWSAYAEAAVYYKNSLYVYGGGSSSPDGAIHLTLSTDRFYKITFEDLPWSEGTYMLDGVCTPCPKGSYKSSISDTQWSLWPPGMYNDLLGGSSIKNWLPCPENYFNDLPGQPFWFKWSLASWCPIGTQTPLDKDLFHYFYTDSQPDHYKSETAIADKYVQYAMYVLFTLFLGLFVAICISKRFRRLIPYIDTFQEKHNYDMGKVMVQKKTFLGGLATCFAIWMLLFLATQTLLYYFYDNIEENKSLIPIVVMKDEVQGNIEITVSLNGYNGECIQSDKSWHGDIQFFTNQMTGQISNLKWEINVQSCLIVLNWANWTLGKHATILFRSQEDQAFAASITVSVTTDSSIPDEVSFISYEMYADYAQVFRGSEPTKFHFFTIPSVFESDVSGEPSQETGYHLSLGDRQELGSQATVQNISKSRYLAVAIEFSQGESALQTKRSYKLRDETLMLAIIGAFAGTIQVAKLLLRLIEARYEQMKKRLERLEKGRHVLSINRQLTDYFEHEPVSESNQVTVDENFQTAQTFYDTNGDDACAFEKVSISQQNSFNDLDNTMTMTPLPISRQRSNTKIVDSFHL